MIPLIGLQPDEIEPCWPTVRPFIAKAMARTGIDKNYDVDHLLQYCKTRITYSGITISFPPSGAIPRKI